MESASTLSPRMVAIHSRRASLVKFAGLTSFAPQWGSIWFLRNEAWFSAVAGRKERVEA